MLIEKMTVGKVRIPKSLTGGLSVITSYTGGIGRNSDFFQVFVDQRIIDYLKSFETKEDRDKKYWVKTKDTTLFQTPTRNQPLIDVLVDAQDEGYNILFFEVVED